MNADLPIWIALCAAVPVLLSIDAYAMRGGRDRSIRRAAAWSVAWTLLGVAFAVVVRSVRDAEAAEAYLAGFLVEKTLSLDNLAVFAMIFVALGVPVAARGRLLAFGIVGAVVLRLAAIMAGAALLETFSWLLYVFGVFLVWTAWRMARGGGHVDLERSRLVAAVRRVVPISDRQDGERLTTRVAGRRMLTPLALALVLVAVFDVVFAVDSIPAIFGITTDTLLVFAANAFSLLGMRALYGVLADLLVRFEYLQVSLAAVLALIGAKMLLVDVVHVPAVVSLAGIVGVLGLGVLASLALDRPTSAPGSTAGEAASRSHATGVTPDAARPARPRSRA